jgi:cathepsin L
MLVATIVTVPFFIRPRHRAVNTDVKDFITFEQWKNQQNKIYASPAEQMYRMRNFNRNLMMIQEVNNDKTLTYKLGLNQFSDLSEEEFIVKYTGFQGIDKNAEYATPHVNKGTINDDNFDWRQHDAVLPVKNQLSCGSCWAFSAIGAVESAWKIAEHQLTSFSEQQLVDCSSDFGNHGCQGGLMNNAFQYLLKKGGIMTEVDYPYTASDDHCKEDVLKFVGKIRTFSQIRQNDCDGLLHAITQTPVSIGIAANAIMSYKNGIFNNPRCGVQLNHGVVALGYGTDANTKQEYWLVRNSWGTTWGEDGYIRFFRDDNKTESGMCGICMAASYPVSSSD